MHDPNSTVLRIAAAGCALLLVLTGCGKKNAKGGGPRNPVVPVLAAEIERRDMPVLVKAIGSVLPPATVSIKPQVTGQVAEAHFDEGQTVEKGALLFTIDKRPFEVGLAQARAGLREVTAQASNAGQQAKRYAELGKSGTVAKEQVDSLAATAKASTATVDSADAAIKTAELQLEYTEIRAPLTGRAGKFLVYPGNVVQANQTDLVVINQVQPIEVTFAVAERYLAEIRDEAARGTLAVKVSTDANSPEIAVGEMNFVDNAVKPASGTIDLKATFKNEPVVLWPGQFVDVELQLKVEPGALVAPARAVQTGQNGSFVFVIKQDQTVEVRNVALTRTVGELAVLGSGVEAGERVVLDGHAQLTPGSKVQVKSGLSPAAPPAAPAKADSKLTQVQ